MNGKVGYSKSMKELGTISGIAYLDAAIPLHRADPNSAIDCSATQLLGWAWKHLGNRYLYVSVLVYSTSWEAKLHCQPGLCARAKMNIAQDLPAPPCGHPGNRFHNWGNWPMQIRSSSPKKVWVCQSGEESQIYTDQQKHIIWKNQRTFRVT
jgi:hypothetical protein